MSTKYQPRTGERCHCKPGQARDNCPDCEGTGMRIDFAAIRARTNKPRCLKFNNPEMVLYMKSMGKIFRVTAICLSSDEANKIMERDRSQALIATDSAGLHYLAQQYGAVCPSALIQDHPFRNTTD